jgi:hypothetical protein
MYQLVDEFAATTAEFLLLVRGGKGGGAMFAGSQISNL